MSSKYPSIFTELNRIVVESVIQKDIDTYLCDMPEILNRMQIGN